MNTIDASSNLGEVESAFDDLQTAWRYAVENKHLAEIQQFTQGFLVYYRLHSWYRAGSGALELYQRALACFDPDTTNSKHRFVIASLYESLGDLHELATAREEALVAFEKALEYTIGDNHTQRGRLYGRLADLRVVMNQYEQGHNLYTQAESVLEETSQRDAAWWLEWIRIQLKLMEMYYWQNRPEDMARIASQIRFPIKQHGSTMQQLGYLYLLSWMALRRDRYYDSSDAIAYNGEALALSLETGNLGEIALIYFSYGFSQLWSNHLEAAETNLQIAREMSEKSGDLTLLARAITYLTVVYRKREDIEHVREYAAYALRVTGEAKMPQYIGMAHAQYAWLAWRAGDLAEAKGQAQAAVADWGGLGSAISVVPLFWMALFPLIGVAFEESEIDQAIQWAKHMLEPPQQRLPDDLTELLESAIAAWSNAQPDAANHLLRRAFQRAHEYHYV